jgi:hypothetical protein
LLATLASRLPDHAGDRGHRVPCAAAEGFAVVGEFTEVETGSGARRAGDEAGLT